MVRQIIIVISIILITSCNKKEELYLDNKYEYISLKQLNGKILIAKISSIEPSKLYMSNQKGIDQIKLGISDNIVISNWNDSIIELKVVADKKSIERLIDWRKQNILYPAKFGKYKVKYKYQVTNKSFSFETIRLDSIRYEKDDFSLILYSKNNAKYTNLDNILIFKNKIVLQKQIDNSFKNIEFIGEFSSNNLLKSIIEN